MDTSTENDPLLEKANIEPMLEFETQIFLDIVRSDGLIIAAKGLNLDLILVNIFKVYQDPGNLVLVLNATDAEQKYFHEKLGKTDVYIEHNNAAVKRSEEYLCGGIHFASTRILVVDLLKKRIPIEKITGIIVLRAHRIFESCNEAFALKLYRQSNKTGFIKAFSNSPQSFTMGFCNVERVMRAIFVKELYIWPRFHASVRDSLKKHEPQVIELHIPISEHMKKLQTYILEIMNATVKELKRINPVLEMHEITVENCLTKKFHKILQVQMNEIWHQLSNRSTQLIAELKTLRHLLLQMFYSDPITFYATILEYRKPEYARTVDWVLNHSAELLFRDAGALVYSGDKEFNPEFCPKWEALLEILKVEVPAEIKKSKSTENTTVLILCSDQRTCHQINELLTSGSHLYLFFLALKKKIPFKTLSSRFKNYEKLPEVAKSHEPEEKPKLRSSKRLKPDKAKKETETKKENHEEELEECEDFQSTYILTMSQSVLEDFDESVGQDKSSNESVFTPFTQLENMDLSQIIESITAPKILIQTFKGGENYVSLQNNLEILKPSFVIMYHSNITTVREIEMYEAHRQSDTKLKIYFLIHAATVEEQAYLTTLRREKEAFEFLIETKANMVVPEDQDGKSDQCLTLQRGGTSPEEKNTRKGGGPQEPAKKIVIVDMREFRSDLPSLIHKRGIEIEPLTITVGDYILTPDICVERKSISDLISSLKSGRLYQQCIQMERVYSKPMLLIEFDQNRPFGWKNQFMISEDTYSFSIQEKLLLLTIHFPKLKIIWSPSPYATAQLFEELKQGKEEPNIEYALAIGGDQDMDAIETKFNSNIYDFIQRLPGITTKNMDRFLKTGVNMQTVLSKSESELTEMLGNSVDAKAMHTALHENCVAQKEPKEKPQYSRGRGRGTNRRGK
ncbi:unnamed protein product [Ceutorhynchus assimilis]|uniref:DNA repair endonuclease XPF n=1 Tax=Ceutorhynchus assimilis TaxID=467358 RepID=A0A9N9QJW0_9CUCU|nr:unnamed protein product [Ceutorhynchus assimilis]